MGEAAGPPVRHDQHEAKPPAVVEAEVEAPPVVEEAQKTSDLIDNFKEEMEREYRKINESLQSAEQFSLMFSKRTKELTSNIYRIREVRELEKEKSKIEESLTEDRDGDGDGANADDGFEQKIKSWPREMVEKQLKHYRVRLACAALDFQ
jgi:predicted nuclease with TOPRIM domain